MFFLAILVLYFKTGLPAGLGMDDSTATVSSIERLSNGSASR